MLTIDYSLLGVKPGERILDAGCGSGRHSYEAYKRDCIVYALDMGEENVGNTGCLLRDMDGHGGPGGWIALRADATNLPFDDGSFDKVVCSEVLEHVPDDQRAMSELVRVLKDDGQLAVSVPTRFSETIYWKLSKDYSQQPGGHIRIYKKGDVVKLLERHGLRVWATRRKHALHTPYWLLRCLFGINRDNASIPSLYHRFLVWDLKTKTRPVRLLDSSLNRFMAKSLVFYASKDGR